MLSQSGAPRTMVSQGSFRFQCSTVERADEIAERVGIHMTEPQEVPYIPRKEEMDCVVQRRRDCQTTKTTD